jgi:hypothetical protein
MLNNNSCGNQFYSGGFVPFLLHQPSYDNMQIKTPGELVEGNFYQMMRHVFTSERECYLQNQDLPVSEVIAGDPIKFLELEEREGRFGYYDCDEEGRKYSLAEMGLSPYQFEKGLCAKGKWNRENYLVPIERALEIAEKNEQMNYVKIFEDLA